VEEPKKLSLVPPLPQHLPEVPNAREPILLQRRGGLLLLLFHLCLDDYQHGDTRARSDDDQPTTKENDSMAVLSTGDNEDDTSPPRLHHQLHPLHHPGEPLHKLVGSTQAAFKVAARGRDGGRSAVDHEARGAGVLDCRLVLIL
jgi:hypothetical protein